MSSSLICESHLRKYIMQKVGRMRPEWDCKKISKEAIDKFEAKLRARVIDSIRKHPTLGKTFKEVQ